ncbi:MAG: hypothetical protein ACHQ1H_11265 [Nitrososphaerales archaeon]
MTIVVAAGGVLAYTMSTQTTGNVQVTSTGTTGVSLTSAQSSGPASNASWSKYLGYIPQGYQVSSREPNAPVFPCPTGMSTAQCQQFQQTCGNGVCDPNETCSSCALDCGVTGSLVCDPYTGRGGAPASVCQVQLAQAANNGQG